MEACLAAAHQSASVAQCVDDGDVGVHFDGTPVEDGGTVAPLADRGQRRLDEQRVAGEDFKRLNGTGGRDNSAKFHAALALNLLGQRRIDGLDSADQLRHLRRFTDGTPDHRRWLIVWGWKNWVRVRWDAAARRAGT